MSKQFLKLLVLIRRKMAALGVARFGSFILQSTGLCMNTVIVS